MRMFARNVVMLWLAMLAMLAMVAVTAVPAFAQSEEEVIVNFELTIDGEVPEGQSVSLGLPGTADIGGGFCSPASDPSLPTCEDGGSYTASFITIGGGEPFTGYLTFAGDPVSYEYQVYAADGSLVETLESETVTPTEDTTVNVTYSPEGGETTAPDPGDGETPPPSDVGEPGPGGQYDNGNPSAPGGQYDNGNPPSNDAPNGNPPSDDATGGQNVGSGQSSASADSSGGQDQSIAVLPDTGGISLAVGLLGALMVGGGLVVRRLLG